MFRGLKKTIRFSHPFPFSHSSNPPASQSPSTSIKTLTFSTSPKPPSHKNASSRSPRPPRYTTKLPASRRRKNPNPRSPPPTEDSRIDAYIASLPPRFTSPDLAAALAAIPNPRHCLPLLLRSTHHRPHLLRPGNPSASLPFLVAIKRLGAAALFHEMDAVASLAFSFSSSLALPESFFNALIHHYSIARWVSKAIGVYKIMRSAKSPASARPSTRTFNLLFVAILTYHRGANSYVRHLYMDALRSLFRQMLDSGVSPDIYAFNAMIKGYVLSLHLNDALRIFHQMVPVYGVQPNCHTYSYLIHGLCAQGRSMNARELHVEMKGKGLVPSARAYNSLVSVLAMDGELDEAVNVMWEAVEMSCVPDFVTCRTVVEGICRRHTAGIAVEFVREMRQKCVVNRRCYQELLAGIEGEYQED